MNVSSDLLCCSLECSDENLGKMGVCTDAVMAVPFGPA